MAGLHQELHRQGGDPAAQPLGADAQIIDRQEQLLLQLGQFRVGMGQAQFPDQGLFGE